jgi:hypothetical protein
LYRIAGVGDCYHEITKSGRMVIVAKVAIISESGQAIRVAILVGEIVWKYINLLVVAGIYRIVSIFSEESTAPRGVSPGCNTTEI